MHLWLSASSLLLLSGGLVSAARIAGGQALEIKLSRLCADTAVRLGDLCSEESPPDSATVDELKTTLSTIRECSTMLLENYPEGLEPPAVFYQLQQLKTVVTSTDPLFGGCTGKGARLRTLFGDVIKGDEHPRLGLKYTEALSYFARALRQWKEQTTQPSDPLAVPSPANDAPPPAQLATKRGELRRLYAELDALFPADTHASERQYLLDQLGEEPFKVASPAVTLEQIATILHPPPTHSNVPGALNHQRPPSSNPQSPPSGLLARDGEESSVPDDQPRGTFFTRKNVLIGGTLVIVVTAVLACVWILRN